MTVQFRDGSTSAVTRQTWSPGFTTGMATRGDGLRRIIFITDGRVHSDPWLRDSDRGVVVRLAREVA